MEWEPIETEPKNRKKVLLLCTIDVQVVAQFIKGKGWRVSWDGSEPYRPTHWMPLPDPPTRVGL